MIRRLKRGARGKTAHILALGLSVMCGQHRALAALPQGKSPDVHFIGSWVGPEPIRRVMERKNYFGFTGVPNHEKCPPLKETLY